MAEPMWIDSAAIIDIADGDTALRLEVHRVASGRALLMVPKVREEVLVGNPFTEKGKKPPTAQQRAATLLRRKRVIEELKIHVDTRGNPAVRRAFFETQFKEKRGRPKLASIEESDAIILSEIAASAQDRKVKQATFFTAERRLPNNADAKLWPVTVIGRTSKRPLPPRTHGSVPGLPPTPTSGTPGMNSGKAHVALAGLLAVGALLNWLSDLVTEERIRSDIEDTEHWIRKQQQTDPSMGILLVVELWQVIPREQGGYWPAPSYQGTKLVYGPNKPTAEAKLQREWTGIPPRTKRVLRTAWIAPLKVAPPRSPASSGKPASWRKRYDLLMNAIDTPPDYIEGLHILNGSSMYDIVHSLDFLAGNGRTRFSILWDRLNGNAPAFLRNRLEAAFSAVSDVQLGTGSIDAYKRRLGPTFTRLSKDDERAIEDYFKEKGAAKGKGKR